MTEDQREGKIEIGLSHQKKDAGGRLIIKVKDSGSGFDFEAKTRELDENKGHCGRGITLIRSMCEQIVYSENGTRVEASYVWENEERD